MDVASSGLVSVVSVGVIRLPSRRGRSLRRDSTHYCTTWTTETKYGYARGVQPRKDGVGTPPPLLGFFYSYSYDGTRRL